jgi:hypothetical protein
MGRSRGLTLGCGSKDKRSPHGKDGELSLVLILLEEVLDKGSNTLLVVARQRHSDVLVKSNLTALLLHNLGIALIVKLHLQVEALENVPEREEGSSRLVLFESNSRSEA